VARSLEDAGFRIIATEGTAQFLQEKGVKCERVYKISEGRPNVVDLMKSREVHLVINTPSGKKRTRSDSYFIRRTALEYDIPHFTTIAGARAAVEAILALKTHEPTVLSLQGYYRLAGEGVS